MASASFSFPVKRLGAALKIYAILTVLVLISATTLPLDAAASEPASSQAELIIVDSSGSEHRLTEQDFALLPQTTLVTHTAWTEGPRKFEGALARDVLSAAGIEKDFQKIKSIEAVALNDYRISIPATDFTDFDVLIARKMDGKPMTRRDKGPYWIVYPRDENPELAESQYDHRWVWQLWRLQIQ
ncbi:molybdopterin-dependent oxidoreductase [Paracoccus methylarcula]|uniref:Molybdopterin-binding oxidoreductase n=1 Tax=Paracoccus methylarcula TaxID=72022 RepID=A0A422QVC2_9RHOB|nr:molybdopterin-dependent oxidoreductase [Paracoccus methylarcula]RNF33908.1 molybdopterin-binding oxidoreductase [Paracoccus methylarcula]